MKQGEVEGIDDDGIEYNEEEEEFEDQKSGKEIEREPKSAEELEAIESSMICSLIAFQKIFSQTEFGDKREKLRRETASAMKKIVSALRLGTKDAEMMLSSILPEEKMKKKDLCFLLMCRSRDQTDIERALHIINEIEGGKHSGKEDLSAAFVANKKLILLARRGDFHRVARLLIQKPRVSSRLFRILCRAFYRAGQAGLLEQGPWSSFMVCTLYLLLSS